MSLRLLNRQQEFLWKSHNFFKQQIKQNYSFEMDAEISYLL